MAGFSAMSYDMRGSSGGGHHGSCCSSYRQVRNYSPPGRLRTRTPTAAPLRPKTCFSLQRRRNTHHTAAAFAHCSVAPPEDPGNEIQESEVPGGIEVGPVVHTSESSIESSSAAVKQTSLDSTDADNIPPLLQASPRAALWKLALPAISIGCMHSMLGLTNAYWIGHLGAAELKAMGGTAFACWMINLLCDLPAIGVHSLTSQVEGAGEHGLVAKTIMQGLYVATFIVLFLWCLIPFTSHYFSLLGLIAGSPERAAGMRFLNVTLMASAPLAASGVMMAGFKGLGQMRQAMFITVVTVAANAVLDPLLIWGLGRVPKLGIAGAALATGCCTCLSAVLAGVLLSRQSVHVRLCAPSWDVLRRIARVGIPITAGGLMFSGVYLAIGRLVGSMPGGPANLGAMGLGHRVESFAYKVCQGFAIAAATLVGQWYGAGRKEEAHHAAQLAARTCSMCMLVLSMLVFFGAGTLVSYFTSDPVIIAGAVDYLKLNSLVFLLMGVEAVYEGAFTGIGNTVPSFQVGTVFNILRLPLAAGLARYVGFGLSGVWIAISFSTIAKALLKMYMFHRTLAKSEPPVVEHELIAE